MNRTGFRSACSLWTIKEGPAPRRLPRLIPDPESRIRGAPQRRGEHRRRDLPRCLGSSRRRGHLRALHACREHRPAAADHRCDRAGHVRGVLRRTFPETRCGSLLRPRGRHRSVLVADCAARRDRGHRTIPRLIWRGANGRKHHAPINALNVWRDVDRAPAELRSEIAEKTKALIEWARAGDNAFARLPVGIDDAARDTEDPFTTLGL